MRRSDSTRLAATALVCLVASVSCSWWPKPVRAEVQPCPLASEEVLIQLMVLDAEGMFEELTTWIADDLIPYCAGIDGINE